MCCMAACCGGCLSLSLLFRTDAGESGGSERGLASPDERTVCTSQQTIVQHGVPVTPTHATPTAAMAFSNEAPLPRLQEHCSG